MSQENGNKEGVRWLSLTDESGAGVLIAARAEPFAMTALHFRALDLDAARHPHELTPRSEVVLCLDARQCALGNGSCGPGVLQRYAVLPSRTYQLRFVLCARDIALSPAVQARSVGTDQLELRDVAAKGSSDMMVLAVDVVGDRAAKGDVLRPRRHRQKEAARDGEVQDLCQRHAGLRGKQTGFGIKGKEAVHAGGAQQRTFP